MPKQIHNSRRRMDIYFILFYMKIGLNPMKRITQFVCFEKIIIYVLLVRDILIVATNNGK